MIASGGGATYIPSLYKSGGIRQRAGGQHFVELSIFEYFFYAFAQYPVNAPAPPIPKVFSFSFFPFMTSPEH
jgi:hypothetical protein